MTEFATFGQELYFDESLRAIEEISNAREPEHLSARIAELLPHPSEVTRFRVASKIVQRYFRSAHLRSTPDAFLTMVRKAPNESAQRDLVYWRTARTDEVIAALAAEVLYPYFVLNTLPKGYDDTAFRMANTGTLFSDDRIISRDFAIRYAREAWDFDSARTIMLALRIMKQAGILDSVTVQIANRHVLGYYPQPHPMQTEVFAYCMYEEFLDSTPTVSLDRVHNGDCVKLFLLNRFQVDGLLRSMDSRKLIGFTAQPGGRHIRFAFSSMDELVASLLNTEQDFTG